MGINLRRVVIGGLVAGAVICVSAVSMVPVVGNDMDLALARFNLPPLSTGAMLFFAAVSLSFGMILVWLYAAVLPRMNRGPKTAMTIAFVVWLFGYFFANTSMVVYGFMPAKLTAIGTAWGLLELTVASLVGSRFYKDEEGRRGE